MVFVVLGDPLVVALVSLHVVAVLFLDELALHTEVVGNLLVSSVKNVVIDLVHPDIALLHLLLGHDAGAVRSARACRRACIAAVRRHICTDSIRHGLARLDQRHIPAAVKSRPRIFFHVIPCGSPRTEIDLIIELVVAAFIPAVDPDQILVILQTRIYDPVCVLQIHVREVAALGCQRAVFAGTGCAQSDRSLGHRVVL